MNAIIHPCGSTHGPTIRDSARGLAWGPGQCLLCWRALHPEKVRGPRQPAAPTARPQQRLAMPCLHLREPTGDLIACPSCKGTVRLKVFGCAIHGRCLPGGKTVEGVRSCEGCPDRKVAGMNGHSPDLAMPGPAVTPLAVHDVDAKRLAPSPDGTHFNASILRYQGRLLLAYRAGRGGSQLHIAELNEDLYPVRTTPLRIEHPLSAAGREDPRLFIYGDHLHCSFIGVEWLSKAKIRTSQLYARLDDRLRVQRVIAPNYPDRAEWEKNWAFFPHDGQLYAVYSIQPHKVLHFHEDQAATFSTQRVRLPWSGGLLRGGAPPVRVGEEYWHWFHGRKTIGGRPTYTGGVLTFEARPPFRPLRITPDPVLWPDASALQAGDTKSVAFCCGAILENGRWLVSYGLHDREIRIAEFNHAAIEKALVAL